MKLARGVVALGLLLGLGCHGHDGIVEPGLQVGKVTLSLTNAPAQITRVVATLSRQGYPDLVISLAVEDSTQGATGSFTDVPVGTWHLVVEALDASNVARFRGETDVQVVGGQTSVVDLELLPTSGSIRIRVRWGGTLSLIAFVSFDSTGSERGGPEGDLYTMLSDGSNQRRLTDDNLLDFRPAISPDGTKVAFQTRHDAAFQFENIWVMSTDGTARTRLTTDSSVIDGTPVWSHDGLKIAFMSTRDLHSSPEGREIYVMNADGTGQTRVTNNSYWDDDPTWSPDGRIAFRSIRGGASNLWIIDADGSNEHPLTTSDGGQPAWSPDGQWIAFVSTQDGTPDIYRIRPDGTGLARLTADAAEESKPTWSPTSAQIAFASRRNNVSRQVFRMDSNGGNVVQLTALPTDTGEPGWRN